MTRKRVGRLRWGCEVISWLCCGGFVGGEPSFPTFLPNSWLSVLAAPLLFASSLSKVERQSGSRGSASRPEIGMWGAGQPAPPAGRPSWVSLVCSYNPNKAKVRQPIIISVIKTANLLCVYLRFLLSLFFFFFYFVTAKFNKGAWILAEKLYHFKVSNSPPHVVKCLTKLFSPLLCRSFNNLISPFLHLLPSLSLSLPSHSFSLSPSFLCSSDVSKRFSR